MKEKKNHMSVLKKTSCSSSQLKSQQTIHEGKYLMHMSTSIILVFTNCEMSIISDAYVNFHNTSLYKL